MFTMTYNIGNLNDIVLYTQIKKNSFLSFLFCLSLLTFRHCLVASSSWPHTVSMTTERHQTGNDGRFAKAHVADNHQASTG